MERLVYVFCVSFLAQPTGKQKYRMSTRGNNPPRTDTPGKTARQRDAGKSEQTKFQLDPVERPDRKPFHFLIADDSAVNRKILRIVL